MKNSERKNKFNGQSLTEFVLTLPIILSLLVLGHSVGMMAYIQHKITQAAYEGTKIVSQVSGNFVVDCRSLPDKSNCLSEAMESRAKRSLEEAKINLKDSGVEVHFFPFQKEEKTAQGIITYTLVGIRITYPFTGFLPALGLSQSKLNYEIKTFLSAQVQKVA